MGTTKIAMVKIFDADGDGYISELYGGEDCEDYHSNIHPDISSDDCGGGNEDCDNQIDEDCGTESSNEEEVLPMNHLKMKAIAIQKNLALVTTMTPQMKRIIR